MQLPFNHNSLYDVPDVTPDIKKSSSKITIHDNHIIYIENYILFGYPDPCKNKKKYYIDKWNLPEN